MPQPLVLRISICDFNRWTSYPVLVADNSPIPLVLLKWTNPLSIFRFALLNDSISARRLNHYHGWWLQLCKEPKKQSNKHWKQRMDNYRRISMGRLSVRMPEPGGGGGCFRRSNSFVKLRQLPDLTSVVLLKRGWHQASLLMNLLPAYGDIWLRGCCQTRRNISQSSNPMNHFFPSKQKFYGVRNSLYQEAKFPVSDFHCRCFCALVWLRIRSTAVLRSPSDCQSTDYFWRK